MHLFHIILFHCAIEYQLVYLTCMLMRLASRGDDGHRHFPLLGIANFRSSQADCTIAFGGSSIASDVSTNGNLVQPPCTWSCCKGNEQVRYVTYAISIPLDLITSLSVMSRHW